jgi:hypothetical protein
MRFLVDECTGTKVAVWLHGQGHDIFSVFDEARGIEDDEVIQKAYDESWILITNDKDFSPHLCQKESRAASRYSGFSDQPLSDAVARQMFSDAFSASCRWRENGKVWATAFLSGNARAAFRRRDSQALALSSKNQEAG